MRKAIVIFIAALALSLVGAQAALAIGPPVINSGPASPTTATDATFVFSLDIPPPNNTMVAECSLDGFPFTVCASPKTYSNLSPATHQFQVRQKKCKDGVCSRPSSPATYSWTITGSGGNPPNIAGVTDPSTNEGLNAVFRVWFTGPTVASTFRLGVTYSTASAADIGPFTYSTNGQSTWQSPAGNGDMTLPAGLAEFHIRTMALIDGLAEANERFDISISPITNGGTVTGSAFATIIDVTQPPGVEYPASYFTGPLGQGNLLPTEDGAFLIAWINAPLSEGSGWPVHQAQIVQREFEIGRAYDGLMVTDWNFEWGENHMSWINSRGSIPIASLNFGSSASVLNGSQNFTIDTYAAHYAAMPFKVMLRLNHEFNYAGLSYTSVGNTQGFVDAWRYVVNRFTAAGASNVGFWWSPAEGGDQSRAADWASYPGDAYVDWVGSDQYNHCYVGEDCYATPYTPGWASFGAILDYAPTPPWDPNATPIPTKHNQLGPSKPYIVGETGTVYDAANPSLKGQWYDAIPEYADANMEWLRGVAFFDVNAAEQGEDPKNNWLVDFPTSNPSVLQGFRNMAQDPFFNAR